MYLSVCVSACARICINIQYTLNIILSLSLSLSLCVCSMYASVISYLRSIQNQQLIQKNLRATSS